jgi:hypothetical protein
MLPSVAVELNDTFLLIGFSKGTTDCKDISIWVPFAALDEHACINEKRFGISQLTHHLKSSALIGNAKTSCIFSRVLIGEPLLVMIIPFNSSEWHLSSLDTS